jgi:hypothetical protein
LRSTIANLHPGLAKAKRNRPACPAPMIIPSKLPLIAARLWLRMPAFHDVLFWLEVCIAAWGQSQFANDRSDPSQEMQ